MTTRYMGPSGPSAGPQKVPDSPLVKQFLVEEFARRHRTEIESVSQERTLEDRLRALRAELMPAQLAFLEDPSERKAAICTRRAGKTHVCKQLVLDAVKKYPGSIIQYIALTRVKAYDLMWLKLKAACEAVGLQAHWNDQELRATFTNGTIVRCGGANDRDEVEKYRGDAYSLVILDEAASYGPRMEELVIAAIEPALMDYQGTLVMVGSPGEAQAGYFWDIYSGARPQWSVHRWSFLTNVHLPAEVRTEEYITKSTGLPLDAPLIQREYYGHWVADANSLVYRYNAGRNVHALPLPPGHDWNYILGVDLGFHDPTAFVVAGWARTYPHLLILEANAEQHLLPSDIAERIAGYKSKYRNMTRIVADTGGSMARSNVEEWNRRYAFGIIGAEKKRKQDFIEHLNSELVLGRVKVEATACKALVKEWAELVWEAADPDSVRTDNRRHEHPGFANHLSDACLYAFRESIHWLSRTLEPDPLPGTPDALRRKALSAKTEAFRRSSRKPFDYNRL